MNSCNFVGRLTADPENRSTSSGKSVCSFTIAVQRPYKDSEGKYQADFLKVVAWERTADYVSNYCSKGQNVSVTGRLETRSYENKDGVKVYTFDIVAERVQGLEKPREGNTQNDPAEGVTTTTSAPQKPEENLADFDPFQDE